MRMCHKYQCYDKWFCSTLCLYLKWHLTLFRDSIYQMHFIFAPAAVWLFHRCLFHSFSSFSLSLSFSISLSSFLSQEFSVCVYVICFEQLLSFLLVESYSIRCRFGINRNDEKHEHTWEEKGAQNVYVENSITFKSVFNMQNGCSMSGSSNIWKMRTLYPTKKKIWKHMLLFVMHLSHDSVEMWFFNDIHDISILSECCKYARDYKERKN